MWHWINPGQGKRLVYLSLSSKMLLALANFLKNSNVLVFAIVYLSFFLDNVLLTVVVPIIPDYLFSKLHHGNSSAGSRLGPKSLSPLQAKYEELDDENGPLGTLLASKAFVQLTFTPLVGYLTEVSGANLPLLLGSCNMLLASLLFAYGNSYNVLVLARALHGSSSAAIAVSGMSILAQNIAVDLRAKLMPLVFGGIALGVLIGYPLGGAAYQLLGKPAPFLLIACLITISIIFQYFYLEDLKPVSRKQETVSFYSWVVLLKDKQLLITTFAICICTSAMAVLEPCVPMWLMGHLDPPPTRWQLGAVFIPDSIGYFIGSHCAGLLPFSSWRIALSSLVLTGLSCCALPLANTIPQLTLPHFGLGLSVGAMDAALVPFLATIVDKKGSNKYGPVYAIQQMFVSLAYAFGPLLGGHAVQVFGFAWLMRFMGFLNLIFCPFLLELEKVSDASLLSAATSPNSYSTLSNAPCIGEID